MSALVRSISFVVIWGVGTCCFGQESGPLTAFEKEIPFKVLAPTEKKLSVQEVLDRWNESKDPDAFVHKTAPKDIYWITLDLGNDLVPGQTDSTFYLKFNTFDHGDVYYRHKGNFAKKPIGQFDKNTSAIKIRGSNYHSFLAFSATDLIDGHNLVLRVQRITFNEDVSNWHFSYTRLPPDGLGQAKSFLGQVQYGFFSGVCFIACFFTLSLFILRKNWEFLFYFIYLVMYFVYLAGDYFGIFHLLFKNEPLQEYWFSQGLYFAAILPYAFFIIHYLDTKKNYTIIHYACLMAFFMNIAILLLIMVFYALDNIKGLISLVDHAIKITNIWGVLLGIYVVFVNRNALVYFIVSANTALCLGALARFYLAKPEDGLFLDSYHYMVIGSSLEIIIFIFGLNYKANMESRENFKLREEALINKIRALRAQINPHFIFNALGSIQYLILNKENKSAMDYLTKFSRMMRNVLESSIETHISLGEEIKMLRDYLELESLRFDSSFSYTIEVDKALDQDAHEVPSMLLQPFVENAIVHGLLPKKEGLKKLSISFKKEKDHIVCEIDDTGIGIHAAQEKQKSYQKEKKSRGLEVTKRRLESLGEGTKNMEIMDKYDGAGHPAGTKVIVKVPLHNPFGTSDQVMV